MLACNESNGGIDLPNDTSHAGRGGSSSSGAASMETSGEAGVLEPGSGGTGAEASGGTTSQQTGSGGTHTHTSSGGSNTGNTGNTGDTGNTGNTGNETGTDPGSAGVGNDAGAGGAPDEAQGGMGGEGDSSSGGSSAASGTSNGGASNGGMAGTSGGPAPKCYFHNPPATPSGVAGGTASPGGVAVATNAFIGPYLSDLAGLTLYIYGADFPGDCNAPPVSNCTADCAQSWPPFDARERTLPGTLDDAVFGTLDRGDGTFQTTYYGWPLYYYKSDTAANQINGQGKGKTWFAAEVALPNLMIMRGPVSGGGIKFLGDAGGHTLYSLAGDTIGTGGQTPVSACTGTCLDSFAPFAPGEVFPVTSIEPHDVSVFSAAGGLLQVAYKGAPLYYSKADTRSGDELGVGVLGGALVVP
jgi:predicted lipoprotein with Yx(FWY)xxD motif